MVVRLSCRAVCALTNLFDHDATLFFDFFRWKNRVEKHICLDVHPLFNILPRHQYHEVGIIRTCTGIIITAIIIHFVIKLLLGTVLCTVEKQMFKEVCGPVCCRIFVAASGLDDRKCRYHGTGMIFNENYLHSVIKIEDRSFLSLAKQRQSLIF